MGDDAETSSGADVRRRSSYWFDGDDINGFNHRAWLKPNGFSDEALLNRPVVGIANTWSELVGCNVHLKAIAEAVKRGVLQAGGIPLEFPVLSLSETLMKPNAMLYRNLASMDVESSIHAHPLDSVVLLSSCDKTTPAVLMGAASNPRHRWAGTSRQLEGQGSWVGHRLLASELRHARRPHQPRRIPRLRVIPLPQRRALHGDGDRDVDGRGR